MALHDYLVTEVALDHAEGHLTRREALRRLGLLGLSAAAASGLLAACSSEAARRPRPPRRPGPAVGRAERAGRAADYDVGRRAGRAPRR